MTMPRLRRTELAVVIGAVGIVGAALIARTLPEDAGVPTEQPRLGRAELVAGTEGAAERPAFGIGLTDLRLGGSRWNDFRAYDVRTGDDDTLYLLTGWTGCDSVEDCYGIVARFDDDLVIDASPSFADAYPGQLAI